MAGAVALGLAAASAAVAQDQSKQPGASTGASDSAQKPTAEAWVAYVAQQLKLTPDQTAAFTSYEALVAAQRARRSSLTEEQFRAMTFPAQLDYVADHLTQSAAMMHTRAEAGRLFYEQLTPEQRSKFDALGAPMRGAGAKVAPSAGPLPLGPPPDNLTSPSYTKPGWLVTPTSDDLSRVYPSEAMRRRLSGYALLKCTVDAEGYLFDCVVSQETPPGMGFGNAALEITAYMRMKPATNNGVPITSAVQLPINFAFPKTR
ncbi:MAG: TonB family protein [Caulobacteraceae bacterium]